MLTADDVPALDVEGSSFQDYDEQVRLWVRTTHLDPVKRAAALVLRLNSVARQGCMPAGGEHLDSHDGAPRILGISENHAAPEAAGPIYQEVARFLHYRRSDPSTGEYIVQFDLFWCRAAQNGDGRRTS